VLHDDLLNPLGNVAHCLNLMRFGRARRCNSEPKSCGLVVADSGGTFQGGQTAQSTDISAPTHLGDPARPGIGYHTSPPLASRALATKAVIAAHIIAIPPLTCSVWPVT
jgi:hypothetical protein